MNCGGGKHDRIKIEVVITLPATRDTDTWKLTDEIASELKHLKILDRDIVFARDGVIIQYDNTKLHQIVLSNDSDEW